MAFQSAPDCASATLTFNLGTVLAVNRLTFAHAGGYDQAAIDDLANNIDLWVNDHVKPNMGAHASYLATVVKGLENQVDLEAVDTTSSGLGTHTGNRVPNNVTWAIRFTTGATGRSARGRMFVIGLTDSMIDEATQSITTSAANAWLAAFDPNLGTFLSGTGWTHVIVSRWLNKAQRTTATYRAVTNYGYFDKILDSQRGRLPVN